MKEREINILKLDEMISEESDHIVDLQLVDFRPKEPRLKRPLDLFLSTIMIVLSLPMWILIAVLIKLEDRGPVFYTQLRWGKDKKKIKIYKFRTMVENSDKKWGRIQASENDSRITRFGKILRSTAIDEIPQLINILKGDISFVGPRALPLNEIQVNEENGSLPDEAIPGFSFRLKVRPGLTGIAQIYAPRDVNRKKKFRYDAIYIKNQSLWLDVGLIIVSFWITFRKKWELRDKKVNLILRKSWVRRNGKSKNKPMTNKKLLGEMLLEEKLISQKQLEECLYYQKTVGYKIGECLINRGYITNLQLESFLNLQTKTK